MNSFLREQMIFFRRCFMLDVSNRKMARELLTAAVHREPTEASLVRLLDEWSSKWKHKGRTRAVGPGAYQKYCTLGLYAHGPISGISRASNDEDDCRAVNHFLRSRFPGKTWTSIAILCNPKMGLHRDLMNLEGHLNHALTLGSFSGGRVWVENENGNASEQVQVRTKVRTITGAWHDIHDKPITFDARRFHQVEPHEGHMWALAAYTPRAFKWLTDENASRLSSLGFPLPK